MNWQPGEWRPPGWQQPGWQPEAPLGGTTELTIEDVEVATESPTVSLLGLYVEIVEVSIDNIEVSLQVMKYGQPLGAEGIDRRAVA